MAIAKIKRDACALLRTRQNYARDVIMGYQAWSGADLKGKARRYGGGYARQRDTARSAVNAAGGLVLPVGNAGRLCLCERIGMDDMGNALYATTQGPAVARASRRLALIR